MICSLLFVFYYNKLLKRHSIGIHSERKKMLGFPYHIHLLLRSDQAQYNVGTDPGPNCVYMLSANDISCHC